MSCAGFVAFIDIRALFSSFISVPSFGNLKLSLIENAKHAAGKQVIGGNKCELVIAKLCDPFANSVERKWSLCFGWKEKSAPQKTPPPMPSGI